jgi:hypothetical protein
VEGPAPQSPEGKFEADRRAGFLPEDATRGGDSAKEEQIARLRETGLTREQAIGVIDGRLKVERDPVTRELAIVDVGAALQGGDPRVYDSSRPRQGGEASAGSIMPGDTDFSAATGAGGFLTNTANTLADMVGAGLVSGNVERATQALSNLQNQTMITLTDAVPGRPSNFLLERFERLTVTPNSLVQGQGRARERLNQTRDMIAQAIEMNEDILGANATPQMRADAEVSNIRLRRLLSAYDQVIESFGRRESAAPPPPASLPEEYRDLWEFMTPEDRALWQN